MVNVKNIFLYFSRNFVLAAFGWMLCEGIIIYVQLVNVYSGLGLGGNYLRVFCSIGWGKLYIQPGHHMSPMFGYSYASSVTV